LYIILVLKNGPVWVPRGKLAGFPGGEIWAGFKSSDHFNSKYVWRNL